MDMNIVYKVACGLIGDALNGWAIETQGGVEFANYVEGIIDIVDELEFESRMCECEEDNSLHEPEPEDVVDFPTGYSIEDIIKHIKSGKGLSPALEKFFCI